MKKYDYSKLNIGPTPESDKERCAAIEFDDSLSDEEKNNLIAEIEGRHRCDICGRIWSCKCAPMRESARIRFRSRLGLTEDCLYLFALAEADFVKLLAKLDYKAQEDLLWASRTQAELRKNPKTPGAREKIASFKGRAEGLLIAQNAILDAIEALVARGRESAAVSESEVAEQGG